MAILLIAFIVLPLIEIAVLIQVGGLIGTWETIALIVLTAVVGTLLFRAQGFVVLRRAQASLDRGMLPAREMFDGVCLLVAGVLLLTPGFVTDAVGLMLLVPPLRLLLGRAAWRALLRSRHVHMNMDGFPGGPSQGPPPDGDRSPHEKPRHRRQPGQGGTVIEGEYREIDAEDGSRRDDGSEKGGGQRSEPDDDRTPRR